MALRICWLGFSEESDSLRLASVFSDSCKDEHACHAGYPVIKVRRAWGQESLQGGSVRALRGPAGSRCSSFSFFFFLQSSPRLRPYRMRPARTSPERWRTAVQERPGGPYAGRAHDGAGHPVRVSSNVPVVAPRLALLDANFPRPAGFRTLLRRGVVHLFSAEVA